MSKTLDVYNQNAEKLSLQYEQSDSTSFDKWIFDYLKSGSKILELGSGSGKRAEYLVRSGFDVIATDGSTEMIAKAKILHPQLNDIYQKLKLPGAFPYADLTFDAVIAVAVLQHLPKAELEAVINEVSRVLKNNSYFFFTTFDNRKDLDENFTDKLGRYHRLIGKDEILELLSKFKFKLVASEPYTEGLARDGINGRITIFKK